MKIAFTIDVLLGDDHLTTMLESLCRMYPDAPIYTLAYKEGSCSGTIGQRSIKSTFLSHKIDRAEDLGRYWYALPKLGAGLAVPCSFDVVISFTRGLGHGFKLCDNTKHIVYYYDDAFLRPAKMSWFQKFFSSYVKNWSQQSLERANKVLSARVGLSGIASELELKPFHRLIDYPIIEKGMGPQKYVLLDTTKVDVQLAKKVMESFESQNILYKWVGVDSHLESLKDSPNDKRFFGQRAKGELFPLLNGASVMIHFSSDLYPLLVFGTLASGRPCLFFDPAGGDVSLSEGSGVFRLTKRDHEELMSRVLEFLNDGVELPKREKMRNNSLRFSAITFKNKIKRFIEESDVPLNS